MRSRCARFAVVEELLGLRHRHRQHLTDVAAPEVVFHDQRLKSLALAQPRVVVTVSMIPNSVQMTPAPLQVGQVPSELGLNGGGFTPLALANSL